MLFLGLFIIVIVYRMSARTILRPSIMPGDHEIASLQSKLSLREACVLQSYPPKMKAEHTLTIFSGVPLYTHQDPDVNPTSNKSGP